MAVLTDNMRGAGLMIASMASFTLNDACMKALSDELPLNQALFLRGMTTVVLMYFLARRLGGLNFRMSWRDRRLMWLRNLLEVATSYFFLTALFNMPIANASAIMQALPLTITLAGAVFLGQAVGWRRLSAILVGFFGVLLIVRPGLAGFNAFSLYVVMAVVMVTGRDIIARKIPASVPSMTVALSNACAVMVAFGLASLFTDWQPLSGTAALQLGGASVFIIGGYIFSVSAMRVGEIAVIAPFRYTSLLVALVLGLVVFGDWPDNLTLIGSAIIVGTGIYTFARERRLSRQSAG